MWMINFYFSKILSIIFPSRCYGCHKEEISLCNQCLKNCKKSLNTPAFFITSIYNFQDPLIKKLIHSIKYFHRKDLISPIVKEIYLEISKTTEFENYIILPIPMPVIRKYIRGYNQAELIAKEIGKQCNLPVETNSLVRLSSPKSQLKTKTKNERLKNQHNSFKVVKDVSGLNILLIDDVTTTGATLIEARNTLLKSGAKSVKAITIAH